MTNRTRIVKGIIKFLGDDSTLMSYDVQDVDKDHKLISKMLSRRGIKYRILVAKDRSESKLWFKKKSNN
jgi:hypothetical protein